MFAKKLFRVATIASIISVSAVSAAEAATRWKMHSAYPQSMPFLGPIAWDIAETASSLSDDLRIKAYDPGALVGATQYLDVVSKGAVDAGFGAPGFHSGKNPALNFLSSVPFGPGAPEFLAWMKHGGGEEFAQEIYDRYNVKYFLCGMAVPETNMWVREEINSLDDLRGMKMRYFGLGAIILEEFGVSTQQLAPGELYQALELGTIDGTEFSNPAVDHAMGFHQVAKHAYFPGWHQQYTTLELLINKDSWNDLSDIERKAIEVTCDAQVARNIAAGEALLTDAMLTLEEEGVQIHRWSDDQLDQFEAAWEKVAKEQVSSNDDSKRIWDSLSEFREKYKVWKKAGAMD